LKPHPDILLQRLRGHPECFLTRKWQNLILDTMKAFKIVSIIFVGLWLAACSHTSTPSPPDSTKQEAPENKPADSPASPAGAESKPQETRETPEAGRTASEDAARPRLEEAGKDTATGKTSSPDTAASKPPQRTQEASETGRKDSADAAGPRQEETGEKAGAKRTTAPSTANAKLEKARENLRISQATEKRIAAELEQLKKSGTASAEDIRDYEIYHERVQAMVAENRKIVQKMEAAAARHSSDQQTPSNAAASGKQEKLMDPDIPEEQTRDEVATLDRELNASLNEFDEKLLRELDTIRDESADKMRDLAEEAAAAAKRLRKRLKEAESEGSGGNDQEKSESSEDADPAETDKQAGKRAETAGSGQETASDGSSRGGGKGPQKDQPRRHEGAEDDDIVARQLREAAENETDPVLKEKLWKEYEEYKKNQS
jgi:hypothetical protein